MVNLPGAGTYSVCARFAPPGYYFVQPYSDPGDEWCPYYPNC